MLSLVNEECIRSTASHGLFQCAHRSNIICCLCLGGNTLQFRRYQLTSFGKPLAITLAQWSNHYHQCRLSGRQHTVLAYAPSDEQSNGSVPVRITSYDFSYNIYNLFTRPRNLHLNQFGRSIEARQVLIKVERAAIIGTKRLKHTVST